jgi:putative flippase GtrA
MARWKRWLDRDTRPAAQFVRYGLVGASATILDLLIFSLLSLWVFPSIDRELGDALRAERSKINYSIAFFAATLYTYVINARFVFVPGRHHKFIEFALFLTVSGLSFALGFAVIDFLILRYSAPTLAAKLASIVVCVLINYACRRFLIFKT